MTKWIAELPTTNVRIVVTILITIATAAVYLFTGRASDGQWLAFLAVMSGLDAAQYLSKRATYLPDGPQSVAPTPAPPDREDVKASEAGSEPPVFTVRPYHPPEGTIVNADARTLPESRPKTSAEAEEGA